MVTGQTFDLHVVGEAALSARRVALLVPRTVGECSRPNWSLAPLPRPAGDPPSSLPSRRSSPARPGLDSHRSQLSGHARRGRTLPQTSPQARIKTSDGEELSLQHHLRRSLSQVDQPEWEYGPHCQRACNCNAQCRPGHPTYVGLLLNSLLDRNACFCLGDRPLCSSACDSCRACIGQPTRGALTG